MKYALSLFVVVILTVGCESTEPTPPINIDTTSHSVEWQTFTIGDFNSNFLHDVSIIDDNNILAVGEFYLKDSLGEDDVQPYNALQWDGIAWTPMRISTRTYFGTVYSYAIYSIISFSANDIWTFSEAGSYSHWNGEEWETEFLNERRGAGLEFWGENSSDLYLVCSEGGISHFDGKRWAKLESGTSLSITDIWGEKVDDGNQILCIASDISSGTGYKLLSINNLEVNEIYADGLPVSLASIWFMNDKKYYLAGDGLYETGSLQKSWTKIDLPKLYKSHIRGTDINNIFLVGSYGLVMHFNGKTWKQYLKFYDSNIAFRRLRIKNNKIVSVGYSGRKALVIIGNHL